MSAADFSGSRSYTPPTTSVVIATYNRADLVGKAISSVMAQTDPDFELIVVDDGSTDDTRQVVGAFRDPRLRYHYQANSGLPASARNAGIRLARGKYVAFLDSDDEWYPEKIRKTISILEATPGLGLVCHNEHIVQDGSVIDVNRCGPFVRDMYRKLLLDGCALSTSATVVRKDLLDRVGGFDERPGFFCVEDYDLWLRLARIGVEMRFVPDILGRYRIHAENSSLGSGPGSIERFHANLRAVLSEHFATLREPSATESSKHRDNMVRTYHDCARQLQAGGEYDRAQRQILAGLAFHPLALLDHLSALSELNVRWGLACWARGDYSNAVSHLWWALIPNPVWIRRCAALLVGRVLGRSGGALT